MSGGPLVVGGVKVSYIRNERASEVALRLAILQVTGLVGNEEVRNALTQVVLEAGEALSSHSGIGNGSGADTEYRGREATITEECLQVYVPYTGPAGTSYLFGIRDSSLCFAIMAIADGIEQEQVRTAIQQVAQSGLRTVTQQLAQEAAASGP